MHALKARLLVSLSLGALVAMACTKSKNGPWVSEKKYGLCSGSCPCEAFCTEQPVITNTSDAGGLYAVCGLSAKIPESGTTVKGMAGQDAFLNSPGTEEVRKD